MSSGQSDLTKDTMSAVSQHISIRNSIRMVCDLILERRARNIARKLPFFEIPFARQGHRR